MQAAAGHRVRAMPDLEAFLTLVQAWKLWDEGTRSHMCLRVLEEEQGSAWRRDPPGDKAKSNSKRWYVVWPMMHVQKQLPCCAGMSHHT